MELPFALPAHCGLFAGGEWLAPASGHFTENVSPATGESLGRVGLCDAADVDIAVSAARNAFSAWWDTPVAQRSDMLIEAAERVRRNREELAWLDAIDGGNPFRAMLNEMESVAKRMVYIANLATEAKGETVPVGPDVLAFTTREPYGVVARLGAFNHPLLFTALKVAGPLVVGNTVVVKPPEQTPLSTLRLAELWGDIFPPGVFNVVPGGRETGAALARHPDVAMVGLIGSVPAGRAVMAAAAGTIKHISLELGGKNPLIVCPDADLDTVADGVVKGMNLRVTTGQSCQSTSRVFAHEDIHDALVERIAQRFRRLRVGPPTDPDSEVGCLSSEAQFERVMRYIAIGQEEGARIVCGGRRIETGAMACGWFIEPTVFADVTSSMRIAREEIFGPVVSILRWRDEKTMLEEVNGLEFGLSTSIWTRDLSTALRLVRRVQAGYVWVNDSAVHHRGLPFGGYKQSGNGREEAMADLLEATQIKSVTIALSGMAPLPQPGGVQG